MPGRSGFVRRVGSVGPGRQVRSTGIRPRPRRSSSPTRDNQLPKRETFLLRTDPAVLEALRRWASDELRSANGQLEFILRRALQDAGRLKPRDKGSSETDRGESED